MRPRPSRSSITMRPLEGTPGSLGLACMWAARPQFHLPHFALGEPLGADVQLTQNNRVGDWEPTGFLNQIQVALMGDPTLRLHSASPVSALTATATPGNILLKWSASNDPTAFRYHVFRATSESGPFTQLTGIPSSPLQPAGQAITTRSWRDKTVVPGQRYFSRVRAVKRESSTSGSCFNLNTGVAMDTTAL